MRSHKQIILAVLSLLIVSSLTIMLKSLPKKSASADVFSTPTNTISTDQNRQEFFSVADSIPVEKVEQNSISTNQ